MDKKYFITLNGVDSPDNFVIINEEQMKLLEHLADVMWCGGDGYRILDTNPIVDLTE